MTILKFLKTNPEFRITNFNKWIIWNKKEKQWDVFEAIENKDFGRLVTSTSDEHIAIDSLMSKNEPVIKKLAFEHPAIEEMNCPECNAVTGHKVKNGFWTCINCETPLK